MKPKELFKRLRFDKNHHLELGDVWITIGQQEEIVFEFEKLEKEVEALKKDLEKEVKRLNGMSSGLSKIIDNLESKLND